MTKAEADTLREMFSSAEMNVIAAEDALDLIPRNHVSSRDAARVVLAERIATRDTMLAVITRLGVPL